MYNVFILFYLAFFSATDPKETLELDLCVEQGSVRKKLSDQVDTIDFKREDFAFFFNLKFNGEPLFLFGTEDKSLLDQVKVGKKIESLPPCAPGTGIANDVSNNDKFLPIDYEGHAHIYAEDHAVVAEVVSRENDVYKCRWNISELFVKNKIFEMKKSRVKQFWVIGIIDKDHDTKIDKGEYYKTLIRLK